MSGLRICQIEGCGTQLTEKNKKTLCNRHLRPCSIQDCTRVASTVGGKCVPHGGKNTRKVCNVENCSTRVVPFQDVCGKHGGKHIYKKCSEENCEDNSHDKTGKCYKHSDKVYQMKCEQDGCESLCRKTVKYCLKHRTDVTMEMYLKILINNMKGHDKKDGYDQNKVILFEELSEICTNQDKKCYWCNRTLLSTNNDLLTKISADRLQNTFGHEKENIVVTCTFCNLAKNNSSCIDFKKYMNCLKNDDAPCFDDEKKFSQWHSQLIARIKKIHLSHLEKLDLNEKENVCITSNWIKNQFIKQNGLSYYTKIPMFSSSKAYYPFQPSVDRIDNNKTYTEDNCVLVCLSENYGRNSLKVDKYLSVIEDIKNLNKK